MVKVFGDESEGAGEMRLQNPSGSCDISCFCSGSYVKFHILYVDVAGIFWLQRYQHSRTSFSTCRTAVSSPLAANGPEVIREVPLGQRLNWGPTPAQKRGSLTQLSEQCQTQSRKTAGGNSLISCIRTPGSNINSTKFSGICQGYPPMDGGVDRFPQKRSFLLILLRVVDKIQHRGISSSVHHM